jgi:putative endonuclease
MTRGSRARWFCYLLQCADGTLYTGITNALDRRLARHNAGTASKYTRSRRPVRLVWSEPARDRAAASRREAALKRLRRGDKQALARGTSASRRRVVGQPRPRLGAEGDTLVGGQSGRIESISIVEREERRQPSRIDAR